MADLAELLEATLDSLPEGIAVLGEDYHVVLWNRAAAAITGYTALEIVGRAAPNALKPLLECCGSHEESETGYCRAIGHGTLLHARHKLGHDVSSMARFLPLHDGIGMHIGSAVVFHPAECLDALPRGETGESVDL
jgi:hypothetical protein